jgi:hypothetical protein
VSLLDKVLLQPEHAAVLPPKPDAIEFEPLGDLLDGEIPPPEILIDDLLYAEGVHEISGHPACGKTTMAMWFAAHQLSIGQHVVWLDMESGARQTARRLQAMGVTGRQAREFLHYAPFPTRIADHLESIAERWPRSLIVIDSMSKALADEGLSENANDEVTGWTVKVVKASKTYGLPVVIIDHITKGGQESDYSRGAGAKQADTDVHWRVEKVEEFNRTTPGLLKLRSTKDRDGYLGFTLWYKVGDGNGNLTITPTTGPDQERDDDGSKPAI